MFGSKKEIYAFIETQRESYALSLLCRVYSVSRFGYYSWKSRGLSRHTQQDRELSQQIERLFRETQGIYGSPKIHQCLKREGIHVGLNRVARIMQVNDLKARCARIYRNHSKMDRFYASIRNEIKDVKASKPNQVWVGDVTYLRVNEEWRYLAVILDKFSRRVIGWSLSKKRNVDLTLTAFKRASKNRLNQSSVYFHSDRGAEYVANKYRKRLKARGVIQSMNGKGVMNDNAEMESFFHHFKAEPLHRNKFMTEKELRAIIIEYVGFYNHKRLHASLNYRSPVEYEVKMV